MNKYKEMKERHQSRINQFPIAFAFNKEQFEKGMQSLGLNEKDTDKVVPINNVGFIRKSDLESYINMCKQIREEKNNKIKEDTTGENFIYDMFYYELNNHEYIITLDVSDTLDALDITQEDLRKNPNLVHGLKLAKDKIIEEYQNEDNYEL